MDAGGEGSVDYDEFMATCVKIVKLKKDSSIYAMFDLMKPRKKDYTLSTKQIIQRIQYYATDVIPGKTWIDLFQMPRNLDLKVRFSST